MFSWLLRGVVMGAVHIVARVALAMAIINAPVQATWFKTIAVAAVVLVSLVWGGVDGIVDGRAHADPDDYADLTMRWLKAALLAGLIAGVVGYILSNYFVAGMGENNILVEVFAGGSFIGLLVFIPAMLGIAVGHLLTRRAHRKAERDDTDDREYSRA